MALPHFPDDVAAVLAEPPSWVLTIMPRLLDVAEAEGLWHPQQAAQRMSAMPGLRYLRRMRVKLPDCDGEPGSMLQWERSRGDLPDALQIRCVHCHELAFHRPTCSVGSICMCALPHFIEIIHTTAGSWTITSWTICMQASAGGGCGRSASAEMVPRASCAGTTAIWDAAP